MATSPYLSLKLRDLLGPEAGDELIGLVDRAANDISDLRGDVAELRHRMELGFAQVDARFVGLERKMDVRFANVDVRFAAVDTQFAELARLMEKQTNRLILWSFAFWVTTLGSVLAVLLVPR